uniref:Uncharacterized protein n=1 Tax=Bombyx mori TaxID=7091 RepID=A0A8R2LZ65_BOMMO|nr:uncharacterized protein LOC119629169 isoform X2 [Bombyx mori]
MEKVLLLQLQEGPTFNQRNVTPAEEKVMKQRTAKSRAARCAIARDTRRSADGMRPALHTQKIEAASVNNKSCVMYKKNKSCVIYNK